MVRTALIGIIGNKGAGKTMIAVYWCLFANCDIVSNMKSIKTENNNKLILFEKEHMFNPQYYDGKIMLIDEYYLESDRRTSLSKGNIQWSYFTQMSRKYPLVDILFIAQRMNLFDGRVVEMFDYVIEAYNNSEEQRFEYTVIRTNDMTSGKFYITYENAKIVFEHYDSNEIPTADKLDDMQFLNMNQKARNTYAGTIALEIKQSYVDYKKKFRALMDIEGYCIINNLKYDSDLLKQIRFALK